MRNLLDTNTCIAAMRHHATVIKRLAATIPADCAISTITSYELFTGVKKCADPANELAKVSELDRVPGTPYLTPDRVPRVPRGFRGHHT
jgi:predicted nucleic acid-binding protein